ncbi:phage holin family protein [Saccharibacillus sp. VR-M41]|uniref:Phage holin family protein n=2 Tax=Saccharibacillus alkalitolerans TaxID=2705290 RepID=A0ABX0F4N5_9BACL|nr:phage holin family protein [Saccharibacillus alkalitolerans]
MLICLLLILIVLNGLTSWAANWICGGLRSRVNLKKIIRKVAIFAVIAIAHLIDLVLGDLHIFRNAVIFFYLANELLSVTENMGKMGVPIPPAIRSAMRIFEHRAKAEEGPRLNLDERPEMLKVEQTGKTASKAEENKST